MRRALLVAALVLPAGCETAPRAKDPAAAGPTPPAALRLAACERDPLAPAPLAEYARALLAEGRPGEAHAALMAAVFLAEHPAAGRPAFPSSYAGDLSREAALAARAESAGARAGAEDATWTPRSAARSRAGTPTRAAAAARAREEAVKSLRLGLEAARAGALEEAVAALRRAANADAAARSALLYADIARLERRIALEALGRGDEAGGRAALLRALRTAPQDPELLFLLARRPAPGAISPEEARWARATLFARHPDAPEARFFAAADRLRGARDLTEATAAIEAFRAENPRASALAAELWGLVGEFGIAGASRDAAAARARYDEAERAALESRRALEESFLRKTN